MVICTGYLGWTCDSVIQFILTSNCFEESYVIPWEFGDQGAHHPR